MPVLRWLYRALWFAAIPLVLIYFWLRGRRDPAYRLYMNERFGAGPSLAGAVWVHAVSLGEMRSAVPLVRALLDRGEKVVTTHLTPAGRQASQTAFASEIAAGRLVARYLPLELGFAYRRFLRCRPILALVMEIEVWPVMIAEADRAGVPLYLANSQYPAKSFARDNVFAGWVGHAVQGVTGVLAKSETHAARFRALGAPNVQVCGELRFDQPIPDALLSAAATLLRGADQTLPLRRVVAVTSVVEGEDASYLETYRLVQTDCRARGEATPLFLHIPRAPERFSAAADYLEAEGQRVLRRTKILDADLAINGAVDFTNADVLVGDSLGEMYFYLALADLVIVGGGFLASGAHNVIEPLALRKPVLVGPNVWSIEYPGVEARAAGAILVCENPQEMAQRLLELLRDPHRMVQIAQEAETFFAVHSGSTQRIMDAINADLSPNPR